MLWGGALVQKTSLQATWQLVTRGGRRWMPWGECLGVKAWSPCPCGLVPHDRVPCLPAGDTQVGDATCSPEGASLLSSVQRVSHWGRPVPSVFVFFFNSFRGHAAEGGFRHTGPSSDTKTWSKCIQSQGHFLIFLLWDDFLLKYTDNKRKCQCENSLSYTPLTLYNPLPFQILHGWAYILHIILTLV